MGNEAQINAFLGGLIDPSEVDARSVRLRRGANVFDVGANADTLHLLIEGRVKLVSRDVEGKETILKFVEPAEPLCAGTVWLGSPFCCSAVVHSETALIWVAPAHVLRAAVEQLPSAARGLLETTATRAMTMCQRFCEVTGRKVEQRIASVIVRLCVDRGQPGDAGVVIDNFPSRQDLADLCGITIESAIRAMRKFERDHIVSKGSDGQLIVIEPMRLRKVIGADARSTKTPLVVLPSERG